MENEQFPRGNQVILAILYKHVGSISSHFIHLYDTNYMTEVFSI